MDGWAAEAGQATEGEVGHDDVAGEEWRAGARGQRGGDVGAHERARGGGHEDGRDEVRVHRVDARRRQQRPEHLVEP